MAPEQAARDVVGPASDVYSLGTILYELLTGRPPFQAASAVNVLLLVRSEEAVRPRLLNPGIPADLELITLKCLEKRPEHRYATAGQLAGDLEAARRGGDVRGTADGPRLGRRRGRVHRRFYRGSDPGPARAGADAGAGDHGRHGVPVHGRHGVGVVLRAGGAVFRGDAANRG